MGLRAGFSDHGGHDQGCAGEKRVDVGDDSWLLSLSRRGLSEDLQAPKTNAGEIDAGDDEQEIIVAIKKVLQEKRKWSVKRIVLADRFGTRTSEGSQFKPKPMLEIGEMSIRWHIMKGYSAYGINEFVIYAGYKQHVIKEWE